MTCVDTFCWHLSLIYLYREDAWNVPVSYFFLNVVISLSLNNTAPNILNDILKIHGLVGNLNNFFFFKWWWWWNKEENTANVHSERRKLSLSALWQNPSSKPTCRWARSLLVATSYVFFPDSLFFSWHAATARRRCSLIPSWNEHAQQIHCWTISVNENQVQFSSRWYLYACKSPHALHPVSQKFPKHCL